MVFISLFCLNLSSCMSARKESYQSSHAIGESQSEKKPLILPTELKGRVQFWVSLVEETLRDSEAIMYGASDCTAFTQLWLESVNTKYGIKLSFSSSSGVGDIALNNGNLTKQDITHVFATDRGLCLNSSQCADEIIIDATYLQFVEHGACLVTQENKPLSGECQAARNLRGLPKVLVGSQAEISKFYTDLPVKTQILLNGVNQNAGNWLPSSAASLIYSFGANAHLRSDLAILEGL
jgi:hypothetical protein